jgi:TAG lipase/steryl ester hydrolase/phospholipase A2/LPA acyltransferase
MIGEKLDRLRALLQQGDSRGLMFEIEEGVHGNLGGMGRATLHNKARFGTKQLITDYVAAVADTLSHLERIDDAVVPRAAKLDLFRRASHCYGRTALMMSSGGMLMFFHFGVAKAMFEQGVLPNLISGSSAGAIVAAVLGTRTDAELQGFFTPENLYFGEAWSPNRLERLTGLRRIFGTESFERTFDRLIPDLTFREAYERSGRNISISVSPCERHQSPRLLNAVTSPHVLIRSAVRASCAVPGLFEPVQLMARDPDGQAVPFLKSRWIDGVFAADLPAKQLARLYGTNHYIVSYVNPVLLLTFRDHRTQGHGLKPIVDLLKGTARSLLKAADPLIGKYVPASSVGVVHKIAHDVLSQEYVGDINITPQRRLFSPLRLVSPYTHKEIGDLMLEGERQTWPRIEMIRISSQIGRTLDGILARVGAGFA